MVELFRRRSRTRPSKLIAPGAVLVAAFVLALPSCAPGPTSVRTSPNQAGSQLVRYRNATVEVPGGWPVYDLGADPRRCARFDVHAVYLGRQGPDAACPARLLGKTEAVQIEPVDDTTRAQVLPAPGREQINGQSAAIEPRTEASHNVVATFPGLGLVVTASFGADEGLAQRIVQSVRAAGS